MNIADKHHPSQINEQIKTLAASALALARRGEIADAERVYGLILAIAPYHASSLSFMAVQAFLKGDHQGSLAYLDKAIQGNPQNPLLLQRRAQVYKETGRYDAAIKDLDGAIALQPDLHTAKLYKAFALKEMGDWNGAIRLVTSVMREIPDLRAWAAGQTGTEQVSELALEAANVVRAAQLSLIDAELQPAIDKFGKDSLQRVFEGVAAFAGLREKDPAAPAQPARSLHIQGLDASPHFTPPLDQWPAGIRNGVQAIRAETQALLKQRNPAYATDEGSIVPGGGEVSSSTYTLNLTAEQLAAAPALAALAGEVRTSDVPSNLDGMALTLAPPGWHGLQGARGENWRRTGYVLLDGAEAVTLSIGGHTVRLSQGEYLQASTLSDHDLEVDDGQAAVLLSLRVWHPGLSPAEVAGLAAVLGAFDRFRAKYL
ncbi:MAG TPA: tetratricopeptide repeat protein [Gammaproteobacteria bacterium]|nr:tetratricopeptide repeat protein [Gammaproteobacteria bacterium]